MSNNNERKTTKIKIRDITEEWGENFGLIFFPDPTACPKCRGKDLKRIIYGSPA